MATTTSRLEKQLENDSDFFWYNVHGSGFGKAGLPDYVAVYNGQFIGIEAKEWNDTVKPNQYDVAEDILKRGGRYIVAYPDVDVDDIKHGWCDFIIYEHNEMVTQHRTHELMLERWNT